MGLFVLSMCLFFHYQFSSDCGLLPSFSYAAINMAGQCPFSAKIVGVYLNPECNFQALRKKWKERKIKEKGL